MINLTQHFATEEQVGVIEPKDKALVRELLTFNSLAEVSEALERADLLAKIAVDSGETEALIGGAPFFMRPLENALRNRGITPRYSFSIRVSQEDEVNGEIVKRTVFKHIDFI